MSRSTSTTISAADTSLEDAGGGRPTTQAVTERAAAEGAADRRLPIGVFAGLTRLTRKALKTYERRGLLRPAYVDGQTRYRYYSLRQARTAETIRLLRTVNVPLRDVAAALRADPTVSLPALLRRHIDDLSEELRRSRRLLSRLEETGADPFRGLSIEVVVAETPAHTEIACAAQCRLETHEATVDRLLDRLVGLIGAHCVEPLARETATYFADFDFSREYRVEVSVPVALPRDRETLPGCRHVLATTAATAIHEGPYSEMWTTSACLFSWVAEHGLAVDDRFCETYLVDERDTTDPDEYRTLIAVPLVGPAPFRTQV